MSRNDAVLLTLVCYKLALVGIGVWASRRTHDDGDFFLGGRRLGAWVAALSASASSSSAWTLLGVSGAAYAWGLSAVWLFPATLSGFLVNWLWVAPRLMAMSRVQGSLTLTQFVAGNPRDPGTRGSCVSAVAIVFSFLFYIAAQFQAAGHAFGAAFGMSPSASIALGAAIVVLYTLLGGFWAVSVTDALQGLLMAAAAVLLPIAALAAVGGPLVLADHVTAWEGPAGSLTRDYPGVLGLGFVLGTLGIGLGYPGQPHVVNRFMALRDGSALARGRLIAIGWAVVIYAGMLVVGFSGRVLWALPDGEQVFFETATRTLPPIVAGLVIAGVLSAIMSTADSQLLVASSSISLDWPRHGRSAAAAHHGLGVSRLVVLAVSASAMLLAIYAPAAIFTRVLFAWHALGSAFTPVVLVRSGAVLASIACGFGLTIVLYLFPDTPGDWAERLLPLAVAFVVLAAGRLRRVE
jgi:sodium/proline symporter